MVSCQHEYENKADFLIKILGLERLPVGVRFLSSIDNLVALKDSYQQDI